MSGPNSSDRETLRSRAVHQERWAFGFGLLVGFGLVIEYWQEIIACFTEGKWPSVPLVGGFLVTLGVFGEVWFGRLALKTADDISERADSDVAQANASAKRAEQAAAEANLKSIELEARLADRHLSEQQELSIGYELSAFTGRKLKVWVMNDAETRRFAEELVPGFERAGLDIEQELFGPNEACPGIVLSASSFDDEFANAIEAALKKVGIPTVGWIRTSPAGEVGLRIGTK